MDVGLAGKHALVTGASKGIGLAIARTLASESCNLHLAARDAARLAAVRASLLEQFPTIEVSTHSADLSHAEGQELLAKRCEFVDILVNNAGAAPTGDLTHTSDSQWRAAWDLKVYGYINLSRMLYRAMQQRRQGVIANIIGYAGERLQSRYLIGSTGNAALIAFTRSLGSESVDFGVRVVGISPSLTATERGEAMLKRSSEAGHEGPMAGRGQPAADVNARLPFGRMATTDEVANVVAFLVSPLASYVSGVVLNVDGGGAYRNA